MGGGGRGEPEKYVLPGPVDANRITVDFSRAAQGRPAELDGRPHAADARPARRDAIVWPDGNKWPQERGGGLSCGSFVQLTARCAWHLRPLEDLLGDELVLRELDVDERRERVHVLRQAPIGHEQALHVLAAQSSLEELAPRRDALVAVRQSGGARRHAGRPE